MKTKIKPSEKKSKLIEKIINNNEFSGFENIIQASVEHVLQTALEAEATDFLSREWYQHSEESKSESGYRNGYYPRTAKTREGKLNLQVPRIRESETPFESQLLKRLTDPEERLNTLAMEMHVRGLSTRDIEATLVDEKGKSILSRNRVSEITESLYAEYEAFSQRDLS